MKIVEFAIERALARASQRVHRDSPRGREILADIKGRRLVIAISGTPWAQRPIVFESTGDALLLCRATSGADGDSPDGAPDAAPARAALADATLTGAPLSLLALTRSDPQAVIRRGGVRIEGDAQLVQRVRELIPLLAPDLEHELSRLIGRSGAHVLALAGRAAADTAQRASQTLVHNLAEYLAHERGELVSRHEAEHFLRGVEQAREQLDRLEARLVRLEQQACGPAGEPTGRSESV